MKSSRVTGLVGLSLTLLLGGCAAGSPAPTVTVTAAEATPTTVATSTSPTTSIPSASSSADASPTAGGVIVVPVGSERTLHLTDAQPTRDWREAAFQPVGSTGTTQGIGAAVYCSAAPDPLEFRFAQNSGKFEATVAQDMASKSSSEQMEWTLIVDGRPLDVKRIYFKESATFSTSLAGVAVVELSVKRSTDKCKDSSIGLVTSVTIQG